MATANSCMGDNSAAFRSVLLDPEDLSVAVERRLVGSRQTGDGLRLSHTEATQLAFLVAPCNLTGKISRREVGVVSLEKSQETRPLALPHLMFLEISVEGIF